MQIETNLQIKQFLEDTRQYLNQMIRIVNIKEQFLGILSLISDMSYGWEKIQDFIPLMQEKIKVFVFLFLFQFRFRFHLLITLSTLTVIPSASSCSEVPS